MKRIKFLLKDLDKALLKLAEAVKSAKTELETDGAIQRFEFSFELLWKALQVYLQKEGIIANSPKSVIKEAFKQGMITNEKLWLQILEDRNMSVHIYSEDLSRDIFKRIKTKYFKEFIKLKDKILSE